MACNHSLYIVKFTDDFKWKEKAVPYMHATDKSDSDLYIMWSIECPKTIENKLIILILEHSLETNILSRVSFQIQKIECLQMSMPSSSIFL